MTPIETWTDQKHAEAAKSLQDASWYALVTIDQEGKIQILDGQPGAVSYHSEHCALVMLEGFAKYHREEFEGAPLECDCDMDEGRRR
jgi:hypothetical protein